MTDLLKAQKNHLLISTLPDADPLTETVFAELRGKCGEWELLPTHGLKITHCIGCNGCWIKTPGLCCIKDDYEPILIKMLQADRVVFLTETARGFVCSQMKNIIDRILPLATMYLKFQDGQMRHYPRYSQMPDIALLYRGGGDHAYLNHWLDRVVINLSGKSFGAFEADGRKELYHALGHH